MTRECAYHMEGAFWGVNPKKRHKPSKLSRSALRAGGNRACGEVAMTAGNAHIIWYGNVLGGG